MSAAPIPLLVVGDSPTLPTGLARIAKDVTSRIVKHVPEVRVAQLGLKYEGQRTPWHVYPIRDEENWGQRDVAAAWEDWAGKEEKEKGVILSFWDPGRCPALHWGLEAAWRTGWRGKRARPELWGYFAVDAENAKGMLGGPVAEVIGKGYGRKLAYAEYGAGVLGKTFGEEVSWLPHGLDLGTFKPTDELPIGLDEEDGWKGRELPIVGCVATNTARKDLGLVFAALEGLPCRLWLHTDRESSAAWMIQELADLYDRADAELLCVTGIRGQELEDEELARWYSACAVTIAPGKGEGFGYPIVESLACGTPVVHTSYAAGKEWIPAREWVVEPEAFMVEGCYALKRPVHDPKDVRAAVSAAIAWGKAEPEVVREYCRLAVTHLDWEELWPWWESWIREGLEEGRG